MDKKLKKLGKVKIPDYLKRMYKEEEKLQKKIYAGDYAATENPFGLDSEQIELLREQLRAMTAYIDALRQRIAYDLSSIVEAKFGELDTFVIDKKGKVAIYKKGKM